MNKNSKSIVINLMLFGVALIMIFPMFWMLLLSLKLYPESMPNFISLLSSKYSIKNYFDVFQSDSFGIYFLNSTIVALFVTIGNIIFCLFTGYALARKKFFGKGLLFATVLGVLIIPPHVIMIPLYKLIVSLSWLNTYWALIIPWLVTPFGIFLVRQYIITLPADVEDAARIDGAGEWYILFRIIMPLSKPILTVLAIYVFLTNWNAFLFPFLFTNDQLMRTLPVGLAFYLGKQSIDWGHLMAGASISAIPVLGLFLIFQNQIIKGLTAGALKE